MTGIVEQVLVERFGPGAEEGEREGFVVHRWLPKDDPGTSRLFYSSTERLLVPVLEPVYGAAYAGILAGRALKLAAPGPYAPFGVPELRSYLNAPELGGLLAGTSNLIFFMDAANVYFYGMLNGEVVEYDAETAELDSLGSPDSAIPDIIDRWLSAAIA
jgi:hypothetical protein